MLETLGLGCVYAITCLKVVILIRKRLCSRLVQEPRSQVIPGLRYKAMCEMWSIIGCLRYKLLIAQENEAVLIQSLHCISLI